MNDERHAQIKVKDDFLSAGDTRLVKQSQDGAVSHLGTAPGSVASPDPVETECERITPSMLSLAELDQQQIDNVVKTVPGGAKNVQDIYALSPLQEGMLFHHLLNQQSDSYLLSILFELQPDIHIDVLTDALQSVLDRHNALRTAILWENLPRPVQVVYRRARLTVERVVLDENREPLEQLGKFMRPPHQKMNMEHAPLARILIAPGEDGNPSYGIMQIHHLVCDYQSWDIVVDETMAYLAGRGQGLPEAVPYRNYVAEVQAQDQAEGFFRGKLADVVESTAPFGLLDVHGDGSHITEYQESIPPALAQQIRVQARRLKVSAARLFHAAWALVVAHTSGRDDVVFGTVLFATRQRRTQTQHMVGMFINTLPLRIQLRDVTVSELVAQASHELAELLSHQSASLALAQRSSGLTGTVPLFTALLNYRRSSPGSEARSTDSTGIRVLGRRGVWTNYPITVSVDEQAEQFVLTAQTDPRVDPQRMTGYLHAAIQSLVKALEDEPHTPALGLSILPETERRQVVEQFNATQVEYSKHKLLHELFEEQVRHTPDAVAVICGDQQQTYAELDRRANQLAHTLRVRGVRPDERVAVYVERSVDMVTGLLGVLKAGGAYVPMDVSYPAERLRHMLHDSAPVVLLTQVHLSKLLPPHGAQVLLLDMDEEVNRQPDCNPDAVEVGLQPRHLAYVIYTSGSTGAPKGVAVEHGNLVNLVQWHCATFDVKRGTRSSCVAAVGFDAAGWEIWPPLSIGATLILAPSDAVKDAEELLKWWMCQPLEVSFLPTPMAEFVFSRGYRNPELRTLLVGGDRLRIRPPSGSLALINNYGPTESTVVATSGEIHDSDPVLHIGRPIANTQIYILDRRRHPVPVGVEGELYIGGAGVARGYLNRPELTAERFIADPFSKDSSARLYMTGDMGRWRVDGTIEYSGRNDHQVKIRGYRIELGEIEAQLGSHLRVKDAVVVAREDVPGETYLVAYFTEYDHSSLDVDGLRAHLKAVLPSYMVPAAFVRLERIPLTPNGKVDARALPAPELGFARGSAFDAPRGNMEEDLARIWGELLQVRRVGRQDSFFELGGHSLVALKLLFKINQAFGCVLKVTDIYRNPTLQDLAAYISGDKPRDDVVDLAREATLDDGIVAIHGARRSQPLNILMTGATGFLGRFLLTQLLQDTDATLYCLVRGQSEHHASVRLKGLLAKWNLWRSEFERRIVVVPSDLGQPRLGIDDATYRMLAQSVDTIYHCATSMNHLESYRMAKSTNVDSARALLRLATLGRPKLVNYISTLSVFSSYTPGMTRVVDEGSSIDQEKHLSSRGYVASKWVGEKIFMLASDRGIPCNIFRVGLAWADTQQGRYDELQNGYRVFKSCLMSGYGISCYRYQMAPTPVDYVARAIVFLASNHYEGKGIFQIASATQPIDGLFERSNEVAGTELELLPYFEWTREIKRLYHEGQSLPVVPLIEFSFSMDEAAFYQHQRSAPSANIQFDCSRTHKELESAGISAPAVDDELLSLYIENILSTDDELRDMASLRGGFGGRRDVILRRDGSNRSHT